MLVVLATVSGLHVVVARLLICRIHCWVILLVIFWWECWLGDDWGVIGFVLFDLAQQKG
jgi:hypothetical protein